MKFYKKLSDNQAFIGTVKSDLDYLSFAVTNKGLLETKIFFQNKEDAINSVLKSKELKNYEIVEAEEEEISSWGKAIMSYLTKTPVKIDIDKTRWTDFQKKVYDYSLEIKAGQIISYGELAKAVNNPKGARAIGMAMKNNHIAPVVP